MFFVERGEPGIKILLNKNNRKNNKKSLSNCIKSTGLTVSPEGQRKTDILFKKPLHEKIHKSSLK